jgi:hypothetical protein
LLGTEIFPYVFHQNRLSGQISQNANFSHFGISLITLFRVSVSENWNDVLASLEKQRSPDYPCIHFENSFENFQKFGKAKIS